MRPGVKKQLFLGGLALLTLALAGPASAVSWRGVVVGKEQARHALVVAAPGGIVRTVRVTGGFRLEPGARVAVTAGLLRDGTFRAANVRSIGSASRARVAGTVVRVMRGQGRFALALGESVLVLRGGAARFLAARSRGMSRGDRVLADVSIGQDGSLTQQGVATVSHSAELEVTGVLTSLTNATATSSGTLTVTVELAGSPAEPFPCVVPAGFPDLSAFLNQLVKMECERSGGQWLVREIGVPGGKNVEDDEDETEFKGELISIVRPTATATGWIEVDVDGAGTAPNMTCTIPAGFDTLGIDRGDVVEVECEGGVVEELELEDDDDDHDHSGPGHGDDDDDDHSGPGHDGDDESEDD